MKSNRTPFWLMASLALLAGCSRPEVDLGVELSPNAYTVSVKILEYSEKVGALLRDSGEKTIAKVMGHEGTLVTTLPTVHLLPGESREVDRRKEHPFLVDSDTMPNRYQSFTTGEYLRVMLTLMPSGAPALAIHLDAPKVVGWEDVLGPGGMTYIYPQCQTILVHSTLSPRWSTWQIVDQNAEAAVVVRIDRPTLSPLLSGQDR